MPDSLTLALIIIAFLLFLIFALNFKIARQNEAHVVERLGKLYKIVHGPALFFNIPLLDRVVQVVPLQEQELNIKLEDPETKQRYTIYLRYKIIDIKLFVYSALDSIKSLKDYIQINTNFESSIAKEVAHLVNEHAENLGIEILEFLNK